MPQSTECPACRNPVAIRDVRPGRFRIACPTCGARLLLAVPDDPAEPIVATAEGPAPVALAPVPDQPGPPEIRAGWVGHYRVVAPGRGRAWGFGPEVELGILRGRWAADPRFLASWVLEALAASGLRHPNLLASSGVEVARNRVFAVGAVGAGVPLADPARGRGTLDRPGRAAAVLHAARGLQFAHEQGVYHRDLTLDAIRVDPEGLITLAGAGLGLTPDSEHAPVAPIPLSEPGSPDAPPPFVPPPPDVETDVTGLGRVLATLVAGSAGDRAVPPGLATIIRRTVGEAGGVPIDPRERFRDVGAVVRALEAELGVGGPLNPAEPEAEAFEAAVGAYQAAPLLAVRRWVAPGFAGLLGLIVLGLAASGQIVAVLGWLAFGGLIASALAGWRGWDARDRIKGRLAPVFSLVGRRDLVTLGVAGLLALGSLLATHLLVTAVIVTALAVGLAAAYHFGLDRPLRQSRAAARERLRESIKEWRLLGYDEAAIRRYVAGAGGRGWEELFADLFGFAALAPARARWGLDLAGGRRPRFAPIRGWLLARCDAWVAGRTADRTQGLLEPILERSLEAQGMHVLTARRRSKRAAAAVVAVLGQYRRAADESVGMPLATALKKAVDHPENFLTSPAIAEAAEPPAWRGSLVAIYEAVGGPRVRFLLGAASLAGALVWMEQNGLYSYDQAKQAALTATVEGDHAHALDQARRIGAQFVAGVARVVDAPGEPEVMDLGLIPPAVARHLNGFALLAAGLILLASSLVRGPSIIPFAWLGAVVPLAPRLIIPSARPLDTASLAAMAVGCAVFAAGLWWRGRQES